MSLHTKYLRPFLAVCEQGSIVKAAEALLRAPSAVTRSIQGLEEDLGVPLFERAARGVIPTEYGKALRHRVERAFAEMEQARQTLLAPPHDLGRALANNAPLFTFQVGERRIEALIALAEQRSMGAVASSIGISQPSVSQALRDVEFSVGLDLFERSAQGMRLTVVGEVLFHHIRRALAELRIARAEIAAMNGMVLGEVRVGALSLGRPFLLPAAISRLAARHGSLTFSTVEGPYQTLANELRAGSIDFILGALRPPEQTEGLEREPLFQDVVHLVASVSHPLARRRGVTLADVLRHPWTLPPRGTPTREVVERALREHGLAPPRVVVETADMSIAHALLLEGEFLTAASPHQVLHELRDGALVALPIALPGTGRAVGILRRTDDHLSPGARLLIDEIRALRAHAQALGFIQSPATAGGCAEETANITT